MSKDTIVKDNGIKLNASSSEVVYTYVRPMQEDLDAYKAKCDELEIEPGTLKVSDVTKDLLQGEEWDDISDREREMISNVTKPLRKVEDMLRRASEGELDIKKEMLSIKKRNSVNSDFASMF